MSIKEVKNSIKDNSNIMHKKKHKAFGCLHKYANPALIGKEREIVAEAIAEKYIGKVEKLYED